MCCVKIDISLCCCHAGRPLVDTWLWAGADNLVEVVGVPRRVAAMKVDGVALELTNADGVVDVFFAEVCGDAWCLRVPAKFLATYGVISGGAVLKLLGSWNGEREAVTVAQGSLCIRQSSADILPGSPAADFVRRGDDVYKAAEVVDGVQHYKLERLVYSSDMEGWGLVWTGDYILEDGVFVEVDRG